MVPHASSRATRLPPPLKGWADRLVRGFLEPSSGDGVDFTAPAGEPALLSADSLSWRVFKNPVVVFIGGVTAVILELAEPRVRTGVWEYTRFRDAPRERIARTGLAAMATVYAARPVAEELIARVGRMHAHVRGLTPSGVPYAADEPELLDWVQGTAAFGFAEAYDAFVSPLSPEARDQLYAEGEEPARLYGATGAPTSRAEMEALFARMRAKLERSEIVFEFLDIASRAAILPPPVSVLQKPLVKAATALVPAELRALLGIDARWLPAPFERRLVTLAARAADRIVIDASPAALAAQRLGLPADWAWRR